MEYVGWSYESAFAAEAASAAAARGFVRAHLVGHYMSYLVDDVELVVSELATNAMVHAMTPFTVTLARRHRSVLLTVTDGSTKGPVQCSPGVTDPRGRGVLIVDQLSTHWGVAAATDPRHAKSVWASFDHDPRRVPA